MLIVRSDSLDPFLNLAAEECLLARVDHHDNILFLWQSAHSLVIGKNQNPWRECRVGLARAEGAKMARRITGGGAVYHDDGNLNFSFFLPRNAYSQVRQLEFICSVLDGLGISAEATDKHSLMTDGGKVSGNAFCFRKDNVLHHGTLLVNTDLTKLHRYLGPSVQDIRTKAVESVPAGVVNLSDLVPGLTVTRVADALASGFEASCRQSAAIGNLQDLPADELAAFRDRHASWNWCYGHTPHFEVELLAHFPWGEVAMELTLDRGRISGVGLQAEQLDGHATGLLEGELIDCPFASACMARRMRTVVGRGGHPALNDLADWIEDQGF